jgi:hypothetical protein
MIDSAQRNRFSDATASPSAIGEKPFNRDGQRVARVRQNGKRYWVALPRVYPELPLGDSLEAVMRRAETVALWHLPVCGRHDGWRNCLLAYAVSYRRR